jgi:hypothetical protein
LDFDKKHGQELIQTVQLHVGCFCCQKPNPSMICSRCHLSIYCNRECQKTDWKQSSGVKNAGDHKQMCSVYCDNRAGYEGLKGSIPVCLYSIREIDEASFVMSMRERSDLFMLEFGAYQEQQSERIGLSFQTSVIKLLGERIRLAAAVTFMVSDSEIGSINHVLLETVDEGPEAEQRLYPTQGGPGSISAAAEEKVLEGWVAYIVRLRELGNASVKSITFGRGLMFVADKSSFQGRLEEANGRPIMWIPDGRHSLGLV